MANKKRNLYGDDDDINKSIQEFKQGMQDANDDANDTPANIPDTAETEDVILEQPRQPVRRTKPVPSVVVKKETLTEIEDLRCPCCNAAWNLVDGDYKRPGCGCAIHPTCKDCQKCEGHCMCRMGVYV